MTRPFEKIFMRRGKYKKTCMSIKNPPISKSLSNDTPFTYFKISRFLRLKGFKLD